MRLRFLLTGVAVALVVAWSVAGNPFGGGDTLPSQSFANPLLTLWGDPGTLGGTILFPSEYAQHSITITLDDHPFVTHPDGRFLIDRIPTGEHRLAVRVKGFEPVERSVTIVPDAAVVLEPIELGLARGKVVGRLVYKNGHSAADIALRLHPNGGITASDNDGIFEFIGVPAGTHELKFVENDYRMPLGPFTLESNEYRNLGLIRVARPPAQNPKIVGLRGDRP